MKKSYKDYIKGKLGGKEVPKFDVGGYLYPYGQTIDDPRNPFHYIALDYVPLPYIPYDMETDLALIKPVTPAKPNLDFSKIKEKLDKDLLPMDKEGIMGEFNKIERELRMLAQVNPYAEFDPYFVKMYNKLLTFANSPYLQKLQDNKEQWGKIEPRLNEQSNSYALDANGFPVGINNSDLATTYRKTLTDVAQNQDAFSLAVTQYSEKDKAVGNIAYKVPQLEKWYNTFDRLTNTGTRHEGVQSDRGGYYFGNVMLQLNALPIIHWQKGFGKDEKSNLPNLTEVQAKLLNAVSTADSYQEIRSNMLSQLDQESVDAFVSQLQNLKATLFNNMQDVLMVAGGLNKENVAKAEELKRKKEELKDKLNKTNNANERQKYEKELKGIDSQIEALELNKQAGGYDSYKELLQKIEKHPKAKTLSTLLQREDFLKLQYAVRNILTNNSLEAKKNYILSSPFLRTLYQASNNDNEFFEYISLLNKAMDKTDIYVASNIVANTTNLMKAQKFNYSREIKDRYDENIYLYMLPDGAGGGRKKEPDEMYQSEAFIALMDGLVGYNEERDEKFENIPFVENLFGISKNEMADVKQVDNTVSILSKNITAITEKLQENFTYGVKYTEAKGEGKENIRVHEVSDKDKVVVVDNSGNKYIVSNGQKVYFNKNLQGVNAMKIAIKDREGNVRSKDYRFAVVNPYKKEEDIQVINEKGEATTISYSDIQKILFKTNDEMKLNIGVKRVEQEERQNPKMTAGTEFTTTGVGGEGQVTTQTPHANISESFIRSFKANPNAKKENK